MRKTVGFLCMGIGAAMLISAMCLLFYNRAEDENAGNAAEKVLPALIATIEEPMIGAPSIAPSVETGAPTTTEMTVAEIDGEEYIGYLSIPVLGLELPVMSEWDYAKLKTAPCRYFGSVKTDDMVICGHNYTRHFGALKNLQAGDPVFFTDIDGVTVAYQVEAVEVLQPTQISEMIDSDYDLTLYTCTYSGQSRVTVRCSREESKNN